MRRLVRCIFWASTRCVREQIQNRLPLTAIQNISTRQRKNSYVTHSHGANALLHYRSVEDNHADPVSARVYEVTYAQMASFFLVGLHSQLVPFANLYYSLWEIYTLQSLHQFLLRISTPTTRTRQLSPASRTHTLQSSSMKKRYSMPSGMSSSNEAIFPKTAKK